MTARRTGFGLVELAIVVSVLAILARVALPVYHDLMTRARVAAALADLDTVRVAALSFHEDTNRWPDDQYPGIVPPELVPYLGTDFRFQREHYQLDWENWILPDGTPNHPTTGVLLGVSITMADPALGQAVEDLVGSGTPHYTIANHYTFIISAL